MKGPPTKAKNHINTESSQKVWYLATRLRVARFLKWWFFKRAHVNNVPLDYGKQKLQQKTHTKHPVTWLFSPFPMTATHLHIFFLRNFYLYTNVANEKIKNSKEILLHEHKQESVTFSPSFCRWVKKIHNLFVVSFSRYIHTKEISYSIVKKRHTCITLRGALRCGVDF